MSDAIRRYRPDEPPPQWPLVADAVRMIVAATCTSLPYTPRTLMTVMGQLACFAERVGTPKDPLVWLSPEVISRYLVSGTLKKSSVRKYSSILYNIRSALLWLEQGLRPAVKLRGAKTRSQPYTPPELVRYRMWAHGLPPVSTHRGSAIALLALGAGCGLSAGEVLAVRGTDVRTLPSGAVVVDVPDGDRLVVCRSLWEDDLAERAEQAGDGYLYLPQRQVERPKNAISNWADRVLAPSSGLPPLRLPRLHSAWVVELLLQRVPAEVIAMAAGWKSTSSLDPYRVFVPPLDQEAMTRLLRGWQ